MPEQIYDKLLALGKTHDPGLRGSVPVKLKMHLPDLTDTMRSVRAAMKFFSLGG